MKEDNYESHEFPNIGLILEDSLNPGLVKNEFKIFFSNDMFHPNDILGCWWKLNMNNIWFEHNNKPKYSNKFLKSYIKFKYDKKNI